jgi:DnaK suppressor protein
LKKKKASTGKTRSSKRPKRRAGKATSRTSGKAGKSTTKRKAKKVTRRKVSGPAKTKSRGQKAKSPATRKAAKPRGLKAGSDSRAEQLRVMLETKRAEIMAEIRRTRQDGIENDRTSFPEVGDLVSASVEKERAFEYGEIGVNALREIDNALGKLEEGTYGICEICGKPIGLRRLKVMPSARLCISCKSKEEASGR